MILLIYCFQDRESSSQLIDYIYIYTFIIEVPKQISILIFTFSFINKENPTCIQYIVPQKSKKTALKISKTRKFELLNSYTFSSIPAKSNSYPKNILQNMKKRIKK